MAKKTISLFKFLMVGLLALLGFTSCSKKDKKELVCMYGTPEATLHINVKVVDTDGNPVSNANLALSYNNVPNNIYFLGPFYKPTGIDGKIVGEFRSASFIPDYSKFDIHLVYYKKLNPDLENKYKDDSVKVSFIKIKDPSGSWDQGTYRMEGGTLTLKENKE
ncbi:MAG: radical SAM-associated putative lipoprotein [Bacteroidales bacterium]|nr:radical SAM-associated putative lipoprotein [Bacteroidales bacterium]